jgi:hypothetical protein
LAICQSSATSSSFFTRFRPKLAREDPDVTMDTLASAQPGQLLNFQPTV